ncbi:hypothetical protein BN9982_320024 [Mycobacterium tuberculosis]|nr:hypothetical protein BN9982_320024 [Mycobacterium tuberculosis]
MRGHARVPRGPFRTNSRRRRSRFVQPWSDPGRRGTMTERDEPDIADRDASLVTLIDQPQCT